MGRKEIRESRGPSGVLKLPSDGALAAYAHHSLVTDAVGFINTC
jgi:hypothetical protein